MDLYTIDVKKRFFTFLKFSIFSAFIIIFKNVH